MIKIEATNVTLISRNRLWKLECRNWNFEIEFDFTSLESVEESWEQSYASCGDNYETEGGSNENTGSDSVIFTEFLFFNILSFLTNIYMTFFIIDLIIKVVKYNAYKEEKMKKYTWLLRNKKDFLGKV